MNKTPTTTLYWIRLPNHTNIFTQGYVGVSSDFKNRIADHRTGTTNVLSKAGVGWEDLVVETWTIPFDTHRIMERGLRPRRDIGWNTLVGGGGQGKPVGNTGENTSHKLTDEDKAAIVMQYATGNLSMEKIGKKFNVTGNAVWYIVNKWAAKRKVFASV